MSVPVPDVITFIMFVMILTLSVLGVLYADMSGMLQNDN